MMNNLLKLFIKLTLQILIQLKCIHIINFETNFQHKILYNVYLILI